MASSCSFLGSTLRASAPRTRVPDGLNSPARRHTVTPDRSGWIGKVGPPGPVARATGMGGSQRTACSRVPSAAGCVRRSSWEVATMRRILGFAGGLLLAWMLLVPAVIAADPNLPHTGRVLLSLGGDIVLPAGEQADVVVVVNGNAVIKGTVTTLVVVDGSAVLSGATAETIFAVRAP